MVVEACDEEEGELQLLARSQKAEGQKEDKEDGAGCIGCMR